MDRSTYEAYRIKVKHWLKQVLKIDAAIRNETQQDWIEDALMTKLRERYGAVIDELERGDSEVFELFLRRMLDGDCTQTGNRASNSQA